MVRQFTPIPLEFLFIVVQIIWPSTNVYCFVFQNCPQKRVSFIIVHITPWIVILLILGILFYEVINNNHRQIVVGLKYYYTYCTFKKCYLKSILINQGLHCKCVNRFSLNCKQLVCSNYCLGYQLMIVVGAQTAELIHTTSWAHLEC